MRMARVSRDPAIKPIAISANDSLSFTPEYSSQLDKNLVNDGCVKLI